MKDGSGCNQRTNMKRITKLLSLALLSAVAFSCNDPLTGGQVEESITVDKTSIEATYDGGVYDITVDANCEWTVKKTNEDGTAADWFKVDKQKGIGSTTFSVKVLANPTGEARSGAIDLMSTNATAFITITQTANPNPGSLTPEESYDPELPENPDKPIIPDEPDEPDQPEDPGTGNEVECPNCGEKFDPNAKVTLEFSFGDSAIDSWPTAKHNGGDFKFPLNGTDYSFIFSEEVYTATGSAGDKYLRINKGFNCGLPTVKGKKLTQIEIMNLAKGESNRKTVVTDAAGNEVSDVVSMAEVAPYLFLIKEPKVDEVYYLSTKHTTGNFIGFTKITLTFE